MKLGEQNAHPRKAIAGLLRVGLGVALVAVGFAAGDRGWLQTAAQRVDLLSERLAVGPRNDKIPIMSVDMAFEDYRILLEQREQALVTGVHLSSQGSLVPAAARLGATSVEVHIQLQEGTAQNLGTNDKWSYEVQVAGEHSPDELEFDRFFLQAPASGDWLSRWIFSEALQQEGLMAARYRFVRLIFNGDDRGLYALQENYGSSLISSRGKPPSAIVGFDTAPLWTAIAQFGGSPEAAIADPVTNHAFQDLRSLGIQTLSLKDAPGVLFPAEAENRALSLLFDLQTGRQTASTVLDAHQYGRFLALIDLWGASQATSPLHLAYYYNSATDRLEPVTVDAQALQPDRRISLTATFDDPLIQMAYVQEAARISRPAYLEELQGQLATSWLRLSNALQGEGLDLQPPWETLRERQTLLQQSLLPGHPILAYERSAAEPDHGTLRIDIANVINLPIEILGFDLAGATFVEADSVPAASTPTDVLTDIGDGVVLRAASLDGSETARFTQFRLSLADIHSVDQEADFSADLDINVAVRLLGSKTIQHIPVSWELTQSPGDTRP